MLHILPGTDQAGERVTFRKADQSPLVAPAVAEGPTPPVSTEPTPSILAKLEAPPKWHMALVAGGLAVVAGLGALAIRGVMRRKS